jgi:hypothetical protein
MSITLPAELLDAVIERTKRDNISRSALTINALTAYLECSLYAKDNTEVIRLEAQLEGKDELIKSKNETIDALRLAFGIRNLADEPREIECDKQDSDLEKRSLQFLEANNRYSYSIPKKKRPSRDLNPSRSLDRAP